MANQNSSKGVQDATSYPPLVNSNNESTVPGGGGSTPIVNDLTSGGTASALSAQQGVALKGLVDANATAIIGSAPVALSADRALASTDNNVPLVITANRAVTLATGFAQTFSTQFLNGGAASATITVTPGSGVTLNGGTVAVTRTLGVGQTSGLLCVGANAFILPGA